VAYVKITKPNSYSATNIEQTHPLIRERVQHEEERKQLSNKENSNLVMGPKGVRRQEKLAN
jgi:hypothetical protein